MPESVVYTAPIVEPPRHPASLEQEPMRDTLELAQVQAPQPQHTKKGA